MILNPIKINSGSIASVANLCNALSISVAELDEALNLPHAERYITKITPKKDGSDRIIHNPHYLIRKIQRRINDRIFSNEKVIVWPDHLYGTIPNQIYQDVVIEKDYIACARVHCNSKSILTLDIRDFFNNLASSVNNGAGLDGAASLSHKKSSNMIYLVIHRLDYIAQVLIPFFDALVWQSKKELDYKD